MAYQHRGYTIRHNRDLGVIEICQGGVITDTTSYADAEAIIDSWLDAR